MEEIYLLSASRAGAACRSSILSLVDPSQRRVGCHCIAILRASRIVSFWPGATTMCSHIFTMICNILLQLQSALPCTEREKSTGTLPKVFAILVDPSAFEPWGLEQKPGPRCFWGLTNKLLHRARIGVRSYPKLTTLPFPSTKSSNLQQSWWCKSRLPAHGDQAIIYFSAPSPRALRLSKKLTGKEVACPKLAVSEGFLLFPRFAVFL